MCPVSTGGMDETCSVSTGGREEGGNLRRNLDEVPALQLRPLVAHLRRSRRQLTDRPRTNALAGTRPWHGPHRMLILKEILRRGASTFAIWSRQAQSLPCSAPWSCWLSGGAISSSASCASRYVARLTCGAHAGVRQRRFYR